MPNDLPCMPCSDTSLFFSLSFLMSMRVALNKTEFSPLSDFLAVPLSKQCSKVSDSCEADHSAVMLSHSLYRDVEVCLSLHAQQ